MQKINLALTLMHGEKVAGWVKNVGAALDELDPNTDDVLGRIRPAIYQHPSGREGQSGP